MFGSFSTVILSAVGLHEGYQAEKLWKARQQAFIDAQARAIALERPLLVVGDPDAGVATRMKRAYSCGDLCIDLTGCPACPVSLQLDITKGIPDIPDNSAVVFVSCVLEYTDDPEAALVHLRRIAGAEENLFVVTVDPNTLTSYFYPGAKFQKRGDKWQRVDRVEKIAVGVSVGITGVTVLAGLYKALRGR